MRTSRKSQFLVFSAAFLLILLLFIYSLETDNSYIKNSAKNHILQNVIYETCEVATGLQEEELNSSLYLYSSHLNLFCDGIDITCNLTITNITSIPPSGNWSELNYTHYQFELNYNNGGFKFNQNITC